MAPGRTISELTEIIIKILIKIHEKYGGACFEKVYEEILYYELCKLGIRVRRQVLLPIQHEDLLINNAYKIDLLVEDRLVVELKSVFPLPSVYFKQVHTQLSLINLKYGMLVNFKVNRMVEGIHRVYYNPGKECLGQ